MRHPIITKELQKQFEKEKIKEGIPKICGKYGRACKCLDSRLGANRSLCMDCPLREYAIKRTYMEIGGL